MTLENQVVSREPSQQLKALGVKQSSLFYWQIETGDYAHEKEQIVPKEELNKIFVSYSAFTVAELGEILPGMTASYRRWGKWQCDTDKAINFRTEADTEADARAKMLIHLIKNDLWKP